jgi:hypothetical protein
MKNPAGRSRLKFLHGQFEQIVTAAPLEPEVLMIRLSKALTADQREPARAAIEKVRQRFIELTVPADFQSIIPGTGLARSMFCVARYRSEKQGGLLTSAVDEVPTLESTDVVQIAIPRYYPPAPPIAEWEKYFTDVTQRAGFTDAQARTARAIFDNLRGDASVYRGAHKVDYDLIGRFKDAEQREAQMRELNRPLDELFEQLKQRLVNVARPEQREKMKKA